MNQFRTILKRKRLADVITDCLAHPSNRKLINLLVRNFRAFWSSFEHFFCSDQDQKNNFFVDCLQFFLCLSIIPFSIKVFQYKFSKNSGNETFGMTSFYAIFKLRLLRFFEKLRRSSLARHCTISYHFSLNHYGISEKIIKEKYICCTRFLKIILDVKAICSAFSCISILTWNYAK